MTLELALLLLGGVFILLPGVVVILLFFAKAAALEARRSRDVEVGGPRDSGGEARVTSSTPD